ncbi:hypothetical protein [Alloactinosynnema sp. L-07]|nr:hypothetical protein [Alloactinosynnema sp. L-07]
MNCASVNYDSSCRGDVGYATPAEWRRIARLPVHEQRD